MGYFRQNNSVGQKMMNLASTVSIILVLTLPTAVAADTFSDTATACLSSLDAGDSEGFEQQSAIILSWRGVFNTDALRRATDCLNRGTGTQWEYHSPTSRFTKSADLAEEKAATSARQMAAAIEAEKAELARQQQIEDTANALMEATVAAELNRNAVHQAVHGACVELLKSDDVAALTNAVCVDSFLRNGLPSE